MHDAIIQTKTMLKYTSLNIYGHNMIIGAGVNRNQTIEVAQNETAKITYRATTEVYRVNVTVDSEEKPGYLIQHNITILNVQGNVLAFRTIYNVSKDVAYSVDDMILPPDAIIIQREPVIALDIKDPKAEKKVNQTIVILTGVFESKFLKGVKIEHQTITETSSTSQTSTTSTTITTISNIIPSNPTESTATTTNKVTETTSATTTNSGKTTTTGKAPNTTTTTSKKGSSICGPGLIVGLSMVTLLLKRRR